jgi:hypothetical protein
LPRRAFIQPQPGQCYRLSQRRDPQRSRATGHQPQRIEPAPARTPRLVHGPDNYGFRDKYFLDLRRGPTGPANSGKTTNTAFFPAASAAWRIIRRTVHAEPFLLSDLKLRASYGLTGNAGAIDPYQSLPLVGASVIAGGTASSGYTLNGVFATGISPIRIANRDLGLGTIGAGGHRSGRGTVGRPAESGGGRVQQAHRWAAVRQKLPLSSGYATLRGTLPPSRNRGIELSADARILDGGLKWSINGNFSVNRNELLSLPDDRGNHSGRRFYVQ